MALKGIKTKIESKETIKWNCNAPNWSGNPNGSNSLINGI